MQSGCGVHPLMLLVQKSRPAWSGSRFRKSKYCCWAKNLDPSIGFGPSEASLSLIITVAFADEPSVALSGLLRLMVNVSAPSCHESSIISTERILEVSPAANVTVANLDS